MIDDTMYMPRESWHATDLAFWDKMARELGEREGKSFTFDMLTIGCFYSKPEFAVTDMLVWLTDVDTKEPRTARLKPDFAKKLLDQLYNDLGIVRKK